MEKGEMTEETVFPKTFSESPSWWKSSIQSISISVLYCKVFRISVL